MGLPRMEKIFSLINPGTLLHLILRENDFQGRTEIIDDDNFLQLSTLKLNKNQEFPAHRHLLKKTNFTEFWAQESWVVVKGAVEVTYFDLNDTEIVKKIVTEGEVSVTLKGGHAYKVIENSRVIEFKTGPYFGREADKILI